MSDVLISSRSKVLSGGSILSAVSGEDESFEDPILSDDDLDNEDDDEDEE